MRLSKGPTMNGKRHRDLSANVATVMAEIAPAMYGGADRSWALVALNPMFTMICGKVNFRAYVGTELAIKMSEVV
jgi:hypothetical protein